MKRPISIAGIAALAVLQGCATSSAPSVAAQSEPVSPASAVAGINPVSAVTICATPDGCEHNVAGLAQGNEIGKEQNAPLVEGHPLTAVVVTQCNLVVAVYMTMPDGRLLRFDSKADVDAASLVSMAYTATRSERVEVSCEGMGTSGYETHGPT